MKVGVCRLTAFVGHGFSKSLVPKNGCQGAGTDGESLVLLDGSAKSTPFFCNRVITEIGMVVRV